MAYIDSSKTVEWTTPDDLYRTLHRKYKFNLDPCCTHENAKCEKHFTMEEDGLSQSWGGVPGLLQPSVRQMPKGLGEESL